ncbi:MAG: DNA polymerase IV [Proteobacteria bacterium]|nr:DNA polymerase IV [Pseudomonadota bacterium]
MSANLTLYSAKPKLDCIHPSLYQRKIIHFDMDAFYASVEIRDNPSLADKPLVIGHSPQSRGVVCTASYVARKFGIRSAMPCSQAARLCPEAIFLEPNFQKYREVSSQIQAIFAQYSSLIEPLSLDEAFLDVTNNAHGLFATRLARMIQDEIHQKLGLTGSAGVAPNKLLAKIASDIHKPRGITVIIPEQVLRFMRNLPLRSIHGIGPASEKRLKQLGLNVCQDVWQWDPERLSTELGGMGSWIWERAQGLDQRPVEAHRERKSLGKETTFASDVLDTEILLAELQKLAQKLSQALRSRGMRGRTLTVKCKYADFTLLTRSQSFSLATDDPMQIEELARVLLQLTEFGRRRIRLLGLSMSNLDTSPVAANSSLQLFRS